MSNQPYPPDPRYQQPPNQAPEGEYQRRATNAGGAYSESQRQSYVDPAGNRVESAQQVFEDPNQTRANLRYWITTVVYFLLGVLEVILALRFIFRLLGANESSGFVTFLYSLSFVFVAPFKGIFNEPTIYNGSVFELSTLVAMLIYALIAWGIVSLARVLFGPNVPGSSSMTTTRRSRY